MVSPSNILTVDKDKSETVYLFITANEDAAPGEKTFIATVTSDTDSKAITLKANIVKSANGADGWLTFKKGLEIGLIVLLVLVVIIGLIVAFNKMKGSDEEGDQTYY